MPIRCVKSTTAKMGFGDGIESYGQELVNKLFEEGKNGLAGLAGELGLDVFVKKGSDIKRLLPSIFNLKVVS